MVAITLIACSANNADNKAGASAKNTNKMTKVELETSLGNIVVELYNETPQHRDNFIKLVKEGYYDGVLFHRVIKDFMIQTGDGNSKTAGVDTPLGDGDPATRFPLNLSIPNISINAELWQPPALATRLILSAAAVAASSIS